jgi:threonyl-tRNA synthetase
MDANDHRAIANRQNLFHQQEEGPGVIFWHPRGFTVYRIIEDYIRKRMKRIGFNEVRTPQLLDRSIWQASGHWQKFAQNMFWFEGSERVFALKPMSCPGHIQIFNERVRSFRDLPLRYFEFGACHRNEQSGCLLGLMRGRAFTQDDAHIFCSEAQVESEVIRFANLLRSVYKDFGFENFSVGFSTRPALRAGDDAMWDRAEDLLSVAAHAAGIEYRLQPGEGAFYGPKLEFVLADNQGREWQCGTIQIDYVLPHRLEAKYIDSSNNPSQPVILHQAVLGSLERFIGMLIEHYQGNLPLWLAPDQIMLASISEAQEDYVRQIACELQDEGYRVVVDTRAERIAKKILMACEEGIPLVMVVGPQEEQSQSVSLRYRDGRQQQLTVKEAAAVLRDDAFR